jgi:hypothetical protein
MQRNRQQRICSSAICGSAFAAAIFLLLYFHSSCTAQFLMPFFSFPHYSQFITFRQRYRCNLRFESLTVKAIKIAPF